MHDADRAGDRQALRQWFDTPLGRSLLSLETRRLRALLPALYGTVAAQLGPLGRLALLDACVAPARIVLDDAIGPGVSVRGAPEALPFGERAVDVIVLQHTLDFCDDPHQVLREASRVLAPEGHVAIVGFNPISLWGLRRAFTQRPRPAPWSGRFLRLSRVKDWLKLLDLELSHGSMFYYRPPFDRSARSGRLRFLDKMGDRWWPMMAAVYLLVAKKRVVGMTPMRVEWKAAPVLRGVVSGAVRRGVVVQLAERRKQLLGQG